MENSLPKIICPRCGQEYLMSEIYLPDAFFGHPTEVIRNDAGKILFALNDDPCTCEAYICDNCDCRMHIDAKVTVNVIDVSKSIEEYKTKLPGRAPKDLFDDNDSTTSEQ